MKVHNLEDIPEKTRIIFKPDQFFVGSQDVYGDIRLYADKNLTQFVGTYLANAKVVVIDDPQLIEPDMVIESATSLFKEQYLVISVTDTEAEAYRIRSGVIDKSKTVTLRREMRYWKIL